MNDPELRVNISVVLAGDVLQHKVCLKEEAPLNIYDISVTLEVSHWDIAALNVNAIVNIIFILITLDVSHEEISPLKDDANANIPFI